MKALILFCIIALGACKTSQFQSGTYRVATAHKTPDGQSRVMLEGFTKELVFPTDTLKKGDMVNFVRLKKK